MTDCESGGIRFIEKSEYDDFLKVCRASSSIPVMNTPVEIERQGSYVDGGIACAVPLFEDIPCESDRLVLVLDAPQGISEEACAGRRCSGSIGVISEMRRGWWTVW